MKTGTFRIRLRPESYGSEHQNECLRQADGKTVRVVAELERGLYLTDFKLAGEPSDSDYARGGFLVVMPDRDGRWK